MKIHEEDTRPLFGRDLKCQDIYVQDHLAMVTQCVIITLIPRFGSFKSCQGMT